MLPGRNADPAVLAALAAVREYEVFYNAHRPRQGIANARPLVPLPEPIANASARSAERPPT